MYAVDVSGRVKQKKDLNYLPWADAWAEIKLRHPKATFDYHENEFGRFWFDDGKTAWVKVSVTIPDVTSLTHTEILPIMDYRNNPISADKVTSFDAAKSIKRCLVKACALHGIGLKVYENDVDIPEKTGSKRGKYHKAQTVDDTPASPELIEARQSVTKVVKDIIAQGIDRKAAIAVIKEHNHGKAQPNAIQTVEDCEKIKELLLKLQ